MATWTLPSGDIERLEPFEMHLNEEDESEEEKGNDVYA